MITTNSSALKNLLLLFLVVAGLYFAKDFLMPLSISAVLATLFLPLCAGLEKRKIPKGIAALVCILILLSVITLIGLMLGWQISELINDIALIKQKAIEVIDRVEQFIFNHLGISAERQSEILKEQQPSVLNMIPVMAGSLLNFLANFILILAYIFLMLYYRVHIRKFIVKLASPEKRKEVEHIIYSAAHVSQQYLVGLSKMIVCLWIMYSVGFYIAGVKNPIMFAILCGLLEIVPFVGNITGTTLTVLVSAVQGASVPMLFGIVLTYGTVQFIQGWFLEPLILGPQVKINPLFTILALVLGELLWGIPGIFLAIPITAMFKIVCDHVESLKPYGFLIGEIESKKDESGYIRKIRTLFKKTIK